MSIAVLFADGFEEVEAITCVDFLRRAGIETVTAGLGSRDIIGGHDIRINTDITVEELPLNLDGILLPGGKAGAEHLRDSDEVKKLVTKLYDAGKLVAAICASPALVLGTYGILQGKKFTCYPGFETFVSGGVFQEDRVVLDGNLITSRGPGTAAEFVTAVVRYLKDKSTADEVWSKTLQK